MKKYLGKHSYSSALMEDCSHLIMCTILDLSPDDIPFRSKEVEITGKIVGSADLMAQMADRAYLEKLLLLYEEFEEAGLPGYNSEFDLLKKTEDFYNLVARKRLAEDFDNVAVAELGDGSRLLLEALHKIFIVCEVGVDDFDGDVAAQVGVRGAVDDSHAAASQLGL